MKYLVFVAMALSACKYEKIAPANYPGQKIYMGAADAANNGPGGNGIYSISSVDVPGQVVRYTVDNTNKKFNLLMGVVRSGLSLKEDINVSLTATTDSVSKLITSGKLTSDTQVLPSSAYTLAQQTTISSGQSSVTFPLVVDLNYLLANPNKKFALAINISSPGVAITPLLGTTIVLIDTKIFFPVANFTFLIDAGNSKKLNFNNTSVSGLTYSWDFGDGSTAVTDLSPSHTYNNAGTYTVKLTAIGITGAAQQSQVSKSITVQ